MAAADQVLQIVELLERIFEHLPAEDLPLVQRTSKLFKYVVDQSIILQRRIYREPETVGELHRRWNHLFFQGLREVSCKHLRAYQRLADPDYLVYASIHHPRVRHSTARHKNIEKGDQGKRGRKYVPHPATHEASFGCLVLRRLAIRQPYTL